MEYVTEVMPYLWRLIENNKKCSVNVTTKENEIIVSIWSGKRWKRFKNKTTDALIANLQQVYQF
jgi:hypothetical protein